jgi:hypothetical protein
MYREPCPSADGVGGSKQTNDEVGEENGECSSFDEGWRPFDESRGSIDEGWRPFDESRGFNENIEWRPFDESRGFNENIARLFGCANAHRAHCD